MQHSSSREGFALLSAFCEITERAGIFLAIATSN